MKLLTKAIIGKLPKLYSTDGQDVTPVVVKFFTPWSNWTWYAIEGEPVAGEENLDGDWEFFGLVEGHEKELGYFRLSELQEVRGPMGLKIERDLYFEGYVLDKVNNSVRRGQ